MLNRYFPNRTYRRTQRLAEDLIVESIKMHGVELFYLPKTFVNRDTLFGDDALRKFESAASLEAYITDVQGFQGQGDLFGKFGVEIRDQCTFAIARRRFEQIRSEKLQSESGFNLLLESTDVNQPIFDNQNPGTPNANTIGSIVLESGTANGYSISAVRPQEGDLLYHRESTTLWEIKFVEHERPFYQFGALYTYYITCEMFEYSSEKLDTGVTEIDTLEDTYTHDMGANELLLEDGSKILFETGSSIIMEEYRVEDTDRAANNEFFARSTEVSGIIDFTEDNPFSETM